MSTRGQCSNKGYRNRSAITIKKDSSWRCMQKVSMFTLMSHGYCDNTSNKDYSVFYKVGQFNENQCRDKCVKEPRCDAYEMSTRGQCSNKGYKNLAAITIKTDSTWKCWKKAGPKPMPRTNFREFSHGYCDNTSNKDYSVFYKVGQYNWAQCKAKCLSEPRCE